MNQEAFEAGNAGARPAAAAPRRCRAPRRPMPPSPPSLVLRGGALRFQRCHVDGFGHAVQRHVHQRGYAARRRGPRGRRKAFPLRSARFVDVHVRVHQAQGAERDRQSRAVVRLRGTSFQLRTSAMRSSSTTSVAGASPSCVRTRVERNACAILYLLSPLWGVESKLTMSRLAQSGVSAPRHRAGHSKRRLPAEAARLPLSSCATARSSARA